MMTQTQMIEENRKRLEVIRAPYNPLTGQGSTSIKRTHVHIDDAPLSDMWLPDDFAQVPFVRELALRGIRGFIQTHLQAGYSEQLAEALWQEFCTERIKYDFEYWAYETATIEKKVDKGTGGDIPFMLNRAQRYYLAELEKLRRAGKPIDIILCKARQWGGSTLTQIYMLWIQLVHRTNWHSVICGAVESQANTVTGMISKVIKHYPTWAAGGITVKTTPFEGSQKTRVLNISGSRYSIGSAEKPDSLRSQNISMAHLTEVGVWKETKGKKPEDLIQAIFGSILSGPYTVKVLESTAKGVGNYFHRTWIDATRHLNNFTPVFVPWFMIDIYSRRIDPKTYHDFIRSMNKYEQWLFQLGATLEAIAWYREKAKEIKDEWRLHSEYPSTAIEAFQSTGRRVFLQEYVNNVRATTVEPTCYGEFVAKDVKGKDALRNIRFEEREKRQDDILRVWQKPDTSVDVRDRYVVSVDIGGRTSASDPSCIRVADRLPMLEVEGLPEIVAEWHGHIELDLLAWKAAQIAEAYGHAPLVIESNTYETKRTEGDNFEYILDEIAEYYDNLYARTSAEQIRQGAPVKYGFHTNTKTKPIIINNLIAAMRDCLYIERSISVTYEMDVYETKDNGEMGAVEGNHDDYVMATAILIYVCYKLAPPAIRKKTTAQAGRTVVSEASM